MKKLSLEHEFTFGKYKGQQVEDVVDDDPSYIRWLLENTQHQFEEEVLQAVAKREKGNNWR